MREGRKSYSKSTFSSNGVHDKNSYIKVSLSAARLVAMNNLSKRVLVVSCLRYARKKQERERERERKRNVVPFAIEGLDFRPFRSVLRALE